MTLGVFQSEREELPKEEVQRAVGLTLGIRARTQAELEQAYLILEPLVTNTPGDAELFRVTADLLRQLGDYAAANRMTDKAFALRPQDENILQTQLQLQWAAGQYFASLNTVDKFLELNAWSSSSLRTRAAILAQYSRFEEAADSARKSLEINPRALATREILEFALKESGNPVEANHQADLIQRLKAVGLKR